MSLLGPSQCKHRATGCSDTTIAAAALTRKWRQCFSGHFLLGVDVDALHALHNMQSVCTVCCVYASRCKHGIGWNQWWQSQGPAKSGAGCYARYSLPSTCPGRRTVFIFGEIVQDSAAVPALNFFYDPSAAMGTRTRARTTIDNHGLQQKSTCDSFCAVNFLSNVWEGHHRAGCHTQEERGRWKRATKSLDNARSPQWRLLSRHLSLMEMIWPRVQIAAITSRQRRVRSNGVRGQRRSTTAIIWG